MRASLRVVVAVVGLNVLVGCTGAPGANGVDGKDGTPGSTGAPGQPGTQVPQGPAGPAGAATLIATSGEPPGTRCPDGGTKLEAGPDLDGDGVLDAAEITATSFICDGAGQSSLVHTSPEPAGPHCAFGGTKLESGLDADRDGTLDPAEIDAAATRYVCNVAPSGTISPSTGIHVAFPAGAVSTSGSAPITVRFTLKDDRGFPLDVQGRYSANAPLQPRFALASFTQDGGIVSPLAVSTRASSASAPSGLPTNFNPLGAAPGHGTLVENGFGAGDYTYTFPTSSTTNGPQAVAFDPTRRDQPHVVWVQVTRQTDLVFPHQREHLLRRQRLVLVRARGRRAARARAGDAGRL